MELNFKYLMCIEM